MALPLIMGAAMGILGGGRYLMGKASERQSESLLNDFQGQLANSQNPGLADMYSQQANQLRNQYQSQGVLGTIMNPFGQQSMLSDLSQKFAADEYNANVARAQAQAEMGNMYSESNMAQYDRSLDEYQQNFGEIRGMQKQYQSAMLALDNPSNLNKSTTLYNLMAIIEPGGRVTQNEDGMFNTAGGLSARAVNWLNEMRGKGLSDTSVAEIRDALNRQYAPAWEAANRAKADLEARLERQRAAGYNIQSPVGSLGIDWAQPSIDLNAGYAPQQTPQATTQQRSYPTLYDSDPTKDPKVQAIPPGGRRRARR